MASETRRPVEAIRPNSVSKVAGRKLPRGPSLRAAASNSIATTLKALSAIALKRRAPCAAMDTWSSWLAEVGIESTLAG